MPKVRIYELAKQIDVSSREIIDKLNTYGKSVNNHMSSLEDSDVKRLVSDLKQQKNESAPVARESHPESAPRPEGTPRPENAPRPEGASQPDGPRPLRPRPEGTPRPDGQRPLRPRPEGMTGPDGQRPLRPRPEGMPRPDGQRPLRPRPEGATGPDGQRPLRPRPEGMPRPDGQRPLRPRPEGMPRPDGQRPLRPRPEGATGPDGQRPLRPRPEGMPRPDGQRPLRPRPEGMPRPEGAPRPDGQRPLRPRPEGMPRPDGQRPMRPRPEGMPRPEDAPRPDGQRPMRPRPEGVAQPSAQPPVHQGEARPEGTRTEHSQTETPRQEAPHAEHPRQDAPRQEAPKQEMPRQDAPRTDRPRQEGQRPDGQRPGGFNRNGPRQDASGTPYRSGPRPDGGRPGQGSGQGQGRPGQGQGQGQSRPYQSQGQGRPGQSQGQGQNRPYQGQGQGRPGQGQGQSRPFQGQGQGRPGQGQGTGGPRPGGFKDNRGAFARPAAGRPPFGAKKDDKKGAEPSKDDRKQDWKKNEQMRTVKDKDGKTVENKENKQFLDRKDGRGKKGQGKGRNDRNAVKRIMPVKVEPAITMITVSTEITVRELAEKLRKSNADIIKILMKKGVMATANQAIDFETATFVAESLGVLVEEYVEVDVFEEAFAVKPDDEGDLQERPPVVVVMGHVDHGKTSLLDVIRNASVQQTEAGGITQHIGAYTVMINGKPITFLDTPGHEAFTAMRMRGAQVTDIAVLVVAANDGVMPQTVEAINHAKAAGVDIIVAINKVDLPSANPDRVKQELTEYGLLVEDWGGETIAVPVSALQKTGIDHLLEMIIIVSEMKELRANPNKPARGSIIEAKLDKGRGPVATVLVQEGTLNVGDPVVAGPCFGKIRAMTDDKGRSVKSAGPSIPVEIIGLSEVPSAGDMFYAATHEKQARQLSETVIAKGRVGMIKATGNKISLDDLFNQIQAGSVKDLNVVVKADVQGSVEALKTSLDKLSNDQVRVRTIHGGVGAITESDVMLASASNAIIIGFNVRPEPMAKSVADTEKVDVRLYRVIYAALDDVAAAMKGMLDPEFKEKVLGHAEIRQLFKASSIGTIAGSYVTDGKITRSAQVRIVRDGRVVYDGHLDTLRRFKDDVREVASGYECGLLFSKFNDIKENDKVEAYIMEEIPR